VARAEEAVTGPHDAREIGAGINRRTVKVMSYGTDDSEIGQGHGQPVLSGVSGVQGDGRRAIPALTMSAAECQARD
jgi:hypothetical protein